MDRVLLSTPRSSIYVVSTSSNRPSPIVLEKNNEKLHSSLLLPFSTSIRCCEGFKAPVSSNYSISPTPSNFTSEGGKERARGLTKDVDVAALGNLCVDVVLNVQSLPPASFSERKAYMEILSASSDEKCLEAGGSCNLAIAAARLGLNCVTVGHIGNDIYGHFLLNVLQEEGIAMIEMGDDSELTNKPSHETLVCWVLVDPMQRHAFCSRVDFTEEPAFSWVSKLSFQVQKAIKQSRILFCNGHLFDDISPGLITSVLECAIDFGTAIFFDPGPRGKSLLTGMPEEREALRLLLLMSDVLLLTADEAEVLTSLENPILAGWDLLKKGVRTKWIIIKVGSKGSILINSTSIYCAPSFKVEVIDTVGCGDSFAAAIAFGFLRDDSPITTLALANAVGAATAMGCGAGRNVASLSQVIDILTVSNFNEDDEMWNDLVDINLDAMEVFLLSKRVKDGNRDHFTRVPVQEVIIDLLPKLESIMEDSL